MCKTHSSKKCLQNIIAINTQCQANTTLTDCQKYSINHDYCSIRIVSRQNFIYLQVTVTLAVWSYIQYLATKQTYIKTFWMRIK